MFYIVGLGNPGTEYAHTRHNIGFDVLEKLATSGDFSSWHDSGAYSGRVATGNFQKDEVILLLPSTFMNDSGIAVKKLVPKGEIEKLIVVYDDVDLPLGELKISFGRGDGGHNGMRSIIASLGTADFLRVRVGVAKKSIWTGKVKRPKGEALANFVLSSFSSSEHKKLSDVLKKAIEAITMCVMQGKEKAMNIYNV